MKTRSSTLKLILAFAAVYIIWGSTYLGIRIAIESIPPFLMAGTRFVIAGSILYIIARIKSNEKLTLIHWRSGLIIGGLLLLGGNGGVVWAEQFVPSGLTALLVSTVPIWIIIMNWMLPNGEKITLKTVIGVFLGFIGLFLLVNPHDLTKSGGVDLIGAGVLLFATFTWAIGSIYSNHAVLPKSKIMTVAIEMISGGILLLIFSFITGDVSKFSIEEVSTRSVLSLIYLIIFGSIIAFTAYMWLLGAAGPSKATTYAYVNPVVALLLGWFFVDEIITMEIVIAMVIILSAVALINTDLSYLRSKIKRQ
ncbi:MAG: EamA family transporter [Ignavibacteria bacterium]|nr:EamA family transporter [Ignavibacteria bacterium]